MVNRLIKTEKDYNDALSRIEELMDAQADTAEAEELELLAALVEMYEERHYPIDSPDPVEAIRFRMEQLGLNQKDLVQYIGSKSKVSEILNKKRSPSLAMMRALHRGLGIPAEVLLREPGSEFPKDLPNIEWTRFPLREMAKRGWIPNLPNLMERAEEAMRSFIGRGGGMDAILTAVFRKGAIPRSNEKTDEYALAAWCFRVLVTARENPLGNAYRKGTVHSKFLRDVAKLSYFTDGPLLAREYLQKNGIHLIVTPHLSKTFLDGAAMLSPDGIPVIGMTLRYDRLDNFWFCLLHELAHLSKHLSPSHALIVDDLDLRGQKAGNDPKEEEADRMASEAIIPQNEWNNRVVCGKPSPERVRALADRLMIHPAIIAGRIRFENKNYRILSRYLGRGQVRRHFTVFQNSSSQYESTELKRA